MRRLLYILGAAILLSTNGYANPAAASSPEPKPSKSNLTVKEWNVDIATNQKVLDHLTVYNSSGKKIEECEYDSKGLKWKKKYEYGGDGKVSRILIYNSSDKLDNIRKFDFDNSGRKKTEYIYDAKGKLKKYKVYEFKIGESE